MSNRSLFTLPAGAMTGRQLFSTAVLQAQIAECCCVQADLQIVASLKPVVDAASGLASLLLTMTVTNNGPSTATGVKVTATVPALSAATVVIKAVPSNPVVVVSSGLQASLGSMTSGQSQNLQCTFVPLVAAGSPFIPVRRIIVAASGAVSGRTLDPNSTNNTFSVSAAMPFPAQVMKFTGGGAMPVNQIVITFTKRLQPGSVNANTFLIANVETGAAVTGSISYDDPSRSATFAMPGNGFPAGDFNVTLVGTGSSTILDIDGLALDGDMDGKPGGNYKHQFGVG